MQHLGQRCLPLIVTAALSSWTLTGACSGATATIESRLSSMRSDIAEMTALRDRLRAKLAQRPSPHPPRMISLKLEGAVTAQEQDKRDVHVLIREYNGRVFLAEARVGGSDQPQAVDPSQTEILPGGMDGTMIIHFPSMGNAAVPVRLAVRFDDPAATGSYAYDADAAIRLGASVRFSASGRHGTVTGSATTDKVSKVVLPPEPEYDVMSGLLSDHHYATAKWLELTSMYLFQDVRALLIAREHMLPYPHTWGMRVLRPPFYAALSKEVHAKRAESKPATPSLESMMDDDGLGLGLGMPNVSPPARGAPGARPRAQLLKLTAPLATRVKQRRSCIERAVAGTERAGPVVGIQDTGDPLFGPWYGAESLPTNATANVLPTTAGNPGAQHWPWIATWHCMGPFPTGIRSFESASMPDVFPMRDVRFGLGGRFRSPAKNKEPGSLAVAPASCDPYTGLVRPTWTWAHEEKGPQRLMFDNSAWVAFTELQSNADRELWLGITVNDHGKLWINDELIWKTHPIKMNTWSLEEHGLCKVRLKEGANKLVFRCDNVDGDAFFRIRVCVSGKPGSTAAAARRRAAQKHAASSRAATQGWRGDGRGKYPDARPPLAWDPYDGINVLWRIPMPYGHATPIIVDDKCIVTIHPHTLVCLDKMTGKELWRRDCDVALCRDEAFRKRAAEVMRAAKEARRELKRLGSNDDERKKALAKQGLSADAAEAELKTLARATRAYNGILKECGARGAPWGSNIGDAYATPVTDGKRLWFKSNTGALGCFDLEGNLLWIVNHGCSVRNNSATSSPILVDDKVIISGLGRPDMLPGDNGKRGATGGKSQTYVLRAFQADSGKLVWTARTHARTEVCGTPIALRLSNGDDAMDVVVSAGGTVVRADDGHVLRTYVGIREKWGSPTSDGCNTFVMAPSGSKAAFRLIMGDRNVLGVRPLWRRAHYGFFLDGNYGIVRDGKLYHSRPPIDVLDLETGQQLCTSADVFYTRHGGGYPPCAMAGDTLYAADNGDWHNPNGRPSMTAYSGAMSTIEPGVPCLVLARNRIEPIHGGFGFEGDRLYVRSVRSTMCFGYTGKKGRQYEAETVAREVMKPVFPDMPAIGEPLSVPLALEGGKYVVGADTRGTIRSWLFAGPFPEAARNDLVSVLGDPAWDGYRKTGVKLTSDGPPATVLNTGNIFDWMGDGVFTRDELAEEFPDGPGPFLNWDHLFAKEVDVFRVVGGPEPNRIGVLATLLRSREPGLYRVDSGHPQASVWIGGKSVKHNQVVSLPAGTVPFAAVISLDDPGTGVLHVRPRLWQSRGSQADLDRWLAHIRRCRPYLERVARLSPESDIGRRATRFLTALANRVAGHRSNDSLPGRQHTR